MKTMEKGKFKEYWKDHKKEILITAAGVVVGAGLVWLGYECCARKYDLRNSFLVSQDSAKNVLLDAVDKYDNACIFGGIYEQGLGLDKLGELADGIKAIGENVPEDINFTHFIAIGNPIEE